MSATPTDLDREKAVQLLNSDGNRVGLIALALAEARDAKERAQAGFLGHDAALCRERARLTEAQARIDELTRWKADLEKVIDLKKARIAQRDELVKELTRERDEARANLRTVSEMSAVARQERDEAQGRRMSLEGQLRVAKHGRDEARAIIEATAPGYRVSPTDAADWTPTDATDRPTQFKEPGP